MKRLCLGGGRWRKRCCDGVIPLIDPFPIVAKTHLSFRPVLLQNFMLSVAFVASLNLHAFEHSVL